MLAAVVSTLVMIQGVVLIVLEVRARAARAALGAGARVNRPQPPGIWVANHLANPIVRHLLRGRTGHRLSRHLALIRYPGRRTGRIYELPVQYATVSPAY